MELTHALALLVVAVAMPTVIGMTGPGLLVGVRDAISHTPTEVSTGLVFTHAARILLPAMGGLVLLCGLLMAVGVVGNFAQVGFMLSAEPIAPRLAKINPLAGFKRLFSARVFVEGLKALVKAIVFGWLAWSAILGDWTRLSALSELAPIQAAIVVGEVIHRIVWRVAAAWLAIAALDYFFQRKQMDKQLRMTRDELKREMKEAETSPEMKMAQNRRRHKLAKGQLVDAVKKADVVITNPTHFAVGIQYDRSKMHAPIVVAKGQDYLALRIRELAEQNKVPIVPNPPLARKLYRQCEIGEFIPRDLFMPVAEILAFVLESVKKAKRR
ncbi:MAG: Flagellar biosynthetic protein FlhB [Fimbriimonadaceae bacterium]|nr:Flagellar biosynthetic protein FlhB [Fimbriimonadaceae bacterium]